MRLLDRETGNKAFIRKVLISLIFVITINAFSEVIISFVDSYCISRFIGEQGLAGISLVSPLNQIVYGVACIFSVGSELLITKQLAKGKSKDANKSFFSNFIFLALIGLTVFLVIFFASKPISKILSTGQTSEQVVEYTNSYLKGLSFGMPFMIIAELFFALAYLDNDKRRPTESILILLFLNIILDLLFAKYFTNKAFGIGLASSISYFFSAFVLVFHFISKKSGIRFSIKGFNFKYISNTVVNGAPIGVKQLSTTLRLYLMNLMILNICKISKGADAELMVAAHHIESTISDLFLSVIAGIISATIMLSSVFYNEEDENSLNELLKEIVKFILVIGGILSIIYFITAPYLAPLWSTKQDVINESVFAMRAKSLSIIFIMFCSTIMSFFQGTKNHLMSNLNSLFRSLILPIVFTAIFGYALGVKGIWIGAPIGYTLFVFIHVTISFIKNKKIKFDSRTLFYLKKDFGYKEDEMYEKEIHNIQDVYSIQNDVLKLCEKFNIDEARKQNLANCAEELANLIVISGFSKNINREKPYASIRVLYKKDKDLLIIRTRDNCEKFDIKEKIKEIEDGSNSDLALNCSIKMILHMAKDIDYSQILKTNNMIIKI